MRELIDRCKQQHPSAIFFISEREPGGVVRDTPKELVAAINAMSKSGEGKTVMPIERRRRHHAPSRSIAKHALLTRVPSFWWMLAGHSDFTANPVRIWTRTPSLAAFYSAVLQVPSN